MKGMREGSWAAAGGAHGRLGMSRMEGSSGRAKGYTDLTKEGD